MNDIEQLTRPAGIVPVNIETTAGLVREVLRLRAALEEIRRQGEETGHPCGPPEYNLYGRIADAALTPKRMVDKT